MGSASQFSSAVIKVNDVADRYRVGESINTTAYQLAEVYWDRVILRQNNGTTRELPFKRIENGLDQAIVQPVVTAPNSNYLSYQAVPSQESSALGQAVQ